MVNLLLVEDDPGILSGLSKLLKNEGYNTISTSSSSEAIKKLQDNIDIALVDINLPGVSGFDLCKKIKEIMDIPVIFLTARDSQMDQLRGYKLGADDYITKPFNPDILLLKLEVVLKRLPQKNFISYGPFQYKNDLLYKNDNLIKLSKIENRLFKLFSENIGQVLTKEFLIDTLWPEDDNYIKENTLSVTVNRLRKKIEEDYKNPQFIKTLFGIGFYLDDK